MSKEIINQQDTSVVKVNEKPLGFEDEEQGDMIIPRIKIVQALSPERKEKVADEGDIINTLTKEKLNGKTFVPVFKFNSNILWKDRNEGGGIACHARNGKLGAMSDGTTIMCAQCRKCEFDNSKKGRDAIPSCTKYINFFGFIAGERIPLILSFAKTNYNEGKKLYSLAKVTMQNMWNNGYVLSEKLNSKNGNEWYTIVVSPAGAASDDDKAFGRGLYESFRNESLNYDMEEGQANESAPSVSQKDIENAEF